MPRIRLILISKDRNYMDALTEFIGCQFGHLLNVSSFDSIDKISEYKNFERCVILIDEDNRLCFGEDTLVFRLSEDKISNVQNHIYKYQCSDNIVMCILSKVNKLWQLGDNFHKSGKSPRIIAVCSAAGGAGSTTISLLLSAFLSQKGNKAFYFGMESFGTHEWFFKSKPNHTLSEFLFDVKSRNTRLDYSLGLHKTIDESSGVWFIGSPESSLEFEELSMEETGSIIESFRKLSELNYVVLDIGTGFSPRTLEVLKSADNIVFVDEDSYIARQKKILWRDDIARIEKINNICLGSKIIEVTNRSDHSETPDKPIFPRLVGTEGIISLTALDEKKVQQSLTAVVNCLDLRSYDD